MKKRKELDALLTMANGKKNGKSKRSKEGHELLRLDSDSNSSDNDELFLAPKKTVVRRPRACSCCSMCLPLVMFILTVLCIVVTGGLIWMHFNLKHDLDQLKMELQKVTQQVESTSSQEATIIDLESKLQRISDVPEKVDTSAIKIRQLNETLLQLKSKQEELDKLKSRVETVESRISAGPSESLQQTIANHGSHITELEATDKDHKAVLDKLQEDMTTVKGQVDLLLHPPTTQPRAATNPPPTTTVATRKDTGSDTTMSPSGTANLILLREEMRRVWDTIGELNVTIYTLSSEHDSLAASVSKLESSLQTSGLPTQTPHPDHTQTPHPDHTQTPRPYHTQTPRPERTLSPALLVGQYDLAQMEADIEYLKEAYQNISLESVTPPEHIPSPEGRTNDTEMQLFADRLQQLETRVSELNPDDLNNNLLNMNTTLGIQQVMASAMAAYNEEDVAKIKELCDNILTLTDDMKSVKSYQDEVGYRLTSITDQIRDLQTRCSSCQPVAAPSPAGVTRSKTEGSTVSTEKSTGSVPPHLPTVAPHTSRSQPGNNPDSTSESPTSP
ncbi:uncharacterized protein [Diadema setosum]|uniref:uncharacterized protein n=1 Tax=Diadema setosum TaxID=31175 RepID=UPI003B3AFA0A